jgi:hypothetical protein
VALGSPHWVKGASIEYGQSSKFHASSLNQISLDITLNERLIDHAAMVALRIYVLSFHGFSILLATISNFFNNKYKTSKNNLKK